MADFSDIPVEQWKLDRLIPYEKNHKKHPKDHVKALAASITEFGLEHPIAVEEDGTIISGHGRRLALVELGREFATVRVFKGITKEQANKLRIAANKTTSNEYDTEVLAAELKDILSAGGDLVGLGLSDKETQVLLEDIGELDLGSMSDDIAGDVEKHEGAIGEAASKAEGEQIPLAKAFGFKSVTPAVARQVTRFLGLLEETSGLKGAEALTSHMAEVLSE